MTASLVQERARAQAAASEWWMHEPFPQDREGHPYLCSRCGAWIGAREGTSRVGSLLLCSRCTDAAFPLSEPAPVAVGTGATIPVQEPSSPETRAGSWMPPPQSPVATRRRRRWPWIVAGTAVVAALGLIVALLVWRPWASTTGGSGTGTPTATSQIPAAPTGLTATTAAGLVTISWLSPSDATAVESYLILRDGVQLATVDGAARSYVDTGLVPGTSHEYEVLATTSGGRSVAAFVVVTIPAPSPESVRVTDRGTGALTLAWTAPPGSPQPDQYGIISAGTGDVLKTVDGTVTETKVAGLDPGSTYTFQVVAVWGDNASAPSEETTGKTLVPKVKAARLTGAFPLRIKVTDTAGGTLTRGMSWTDTWTFRPVCSDGPCKTVLSGAITPPGFTEHSFKVTLHRDGAVYTGQTRAQITTCGVSPLVKHVTNTVTVRIRVTSGHVVNGEWIADSWKGTLRLRSPYTTAGLYYCPAQTVTMSLTGR